MNELTLSCGRLWLENDNGPLACQVTDVTDEIDSDLKSYNKDYGLAKSCLLVPELPDQFKWERLALASDFPVSAANLVTSLGDRNYLGGIWWVDDLLVAAAVYRQELSDYAALDPSCLPYYQAVDNGVKDQLLFQVSVKAAKDTAPSDLSLDFSFDELRRYYKWLKFKEQQQYDQVKALAEQQAAAAKQAAEE